MTINYNESIEKIKSNLATAIYGKSECIDVLTIAILAGGSVLIEDVPGVGKTTLAKALAQSLRAKFSRIQFTPDLLPADITGSAMFLQAERKFEFRKGPIFCNVLLADEINRASPRTQSALLEAMCEGQVTVDGITHVLTEPFIVIATQNPIDFHGTYPLPEAQLDRFLVRLDIGYPDQQAESDIILTQSHSKPIDDVAPVIDCKELLEIRSAVRKIHIAKELSDYITSIAAKTRTDDRLKLGMSTRSSVMLACACQAAALVDSRDFITPDDVQRMSRYVLPHRVIMDAGANYAGITSLDVIVDIIKNTAVPV
jgi:MoxR-like ATPase